MIGTVVGSYTIVGRLGEGGMGVVYAARHALLGRKAAIKVLLPELSRRPEVVDRFFDEGRAMTSIADPGIVQIYDFGYTTDGAAYIVMELLDGESLDDRLRRLGPLPARLALRIVRQVATSLAAAHAAGVIHRDLKPENIFLVRDPEAVDSERAKVLDFGIAKLSDDGHRAHTRTGAFLGTPTYMSPEQCRGAGEVDGRSDIYALGCILFHLVTGRPPFDGGGIGEIVAAHLREPAPAPSAVLPGVPRSVDDLVARCLAKAADDRYPSMIELAHALAAAQARLSAGITGDRAGPDARTVLAADAAAPPTTLGGAAGATTTTTTTTRPTRWLLGGVIAAVAAASALAIVVLSRAPSGSAGGTTAVPMLVDAGLAPLDATPTSAGPPVAAATTSPDAAPPSLDAAPAALTGAPQPAGASAPRPSSRRIHGPRPSPSPAVPAPPRAAVDPYDLRLPVDRAGGDGGDGGR